MERKLNFKPKQCTCCGQVHENLSKCKPGKTITLKEYFKYFPRSLTLYEDLGVTHQVDCQCGSTLYVTEDVGDI